MNETKNTESETDSPALAVGCSDLFDKLSRFLILGGSIGEPQHDGDTWELGYNFGAGYCIESEGETLKGAVSLMDDETIIFMESNVKLNRRPIDDAKH